MPTRGTHGPSGSAEPAGRFSGGPAGWSGDAPPILAQYSAEPKYDLQTIVSLVGVRPMILYGWEQQLGVPWNHRAEDEPGPGGRRYAERDLVALLWLREQIFQGKAPSDAAALLHAAQRSADSWVDRPPAGDPSAGLRTPLSSPPLPSNPLLVEAPPPPPPGADDREER